MNKLASQIIVDILQRAMKLPANSVWLRDQNRVIPQDQALYISVGLVNSYVLSNQTYIRDGAPLNTWDQLGQQYDTPPDGYDVPGRVWDAGQDYDAQQGMNYDGNPVENFDQPDQTFDVPGETWDAKQNATTEVNRLQVREDIQIDIWSKGNQAIFRNWEVVAALQGIYSQQQQELINFKIMRLPRGMFNTSSAEGPSQLNRYTITISCFVWYVKETLLTSDGGDYYDDFHQRVDDYKTIGSQPPYQYDQGDNFDQGQPYDQKPPLIQFEINQQGIQP